MNALVINPYDTGSHRQWAKGIIEHLGDVWPGKIELWTLPGRNWKWRMFGACATFAERATETSMIPDFVITTDMMNVASFRGMLPESWKSTKVIQYFHENQLTYPWSENDKEKAEGHDRSYGFINIQSAMAADELWFNSTFHQSVFFDSAQAFISQLPDATQSYSIPRLRQKSKVVPLGIATQPKPADREPPKCPIILWNHRWEYDKGPDQFLGILDCLEKAQMPFNLILCGEKFRNLPDSFELIHERFKRQILHSGFVENKLTYYDLIQQSDFIIHAPRQEYFGLSVAEAMSMGVVPLLSKGQAYESWIPEEFLFDEISEVPQRLTSMLSEFNLLRRQSHELASQYFWPSVVSKIAQNLV